MAACNCCGKCCKYFFCYFLFPQLLWLVIISLKNAYHVQLPKWFEKSGCSNSQLNQEACFCPDFDIADYDSSFVSFDVCLSNNSTLSNLQNCVIYHSYTFTRGAVSNASTKVENILIYLSDFNTSHNQLNNECSESSLCEMNDIFAHILVFDYQKSFNYTHYISHYPKSYITKTYVSHYSIKLTHHEFKDSTFPTETTTTSTIEHILHFKSQINISFVTEYGCFNRTYRGNNILFQHIHARQPKNASYTPIVVLKHLNLVKQTGESVRLFITFTPQSIFQFKIQSLLHMNDKEIYDSLFKAPEMLTSYQILQGFTMTLAGGGNLNSINSLDEIQNWLTKSLIINVAGVIAIMLSLISFYADFKYWTSSTLTMKNVCCAAILIYSIIPLIYAQKPAYVTMSDNLDNSIFKEPQSTNTLNSNAEDDFDELYKDFNKHFGHILAIGRQADFSGIVMAFIVMIPMLLITVFVSVIFPILKAIKSFKLKHEEGVKNDVVAVFEGLLVIVGCVVIGCKDELMCYFCRYVGMAIFIPQILINYCLGDSMDAIPKLPLIVWCSAIADQTITVVMFYYNEKDMEITTFDIVYWIRDVVILIILHFQWRFRKKKK
eukprot:163456_1